MPTPSLALLPSQLEALTTRGRELLLAAEPLSGASHALRAIAIARAWETRHLTVYLTCATEESLRSDHLFEGPTSLWGMLQPFVDAGTAQHMPGRAVRFANGSTLIYCTWERARNRAPDLLLVDDGDAMPFPLYLKLLDRVVRRAGEKPRMVLAARRPGEGWIAQAWNGADPGRVRVEMRAADLPEVVRAAIPKPKPLLSFGDYIDLVMPGYRWYRHTEFMVEQAERLVIPLPGEDAPEINRLGVLAPSRHAKSLTWSALFPAWRLYRRPEEWVFGVAADDLLALKFSQDARTFYAQGGGAFRIDQKSAELWRTLRGGAMLARTLKQGFFGFGFNHLTIDDPYGSFDAAQSPRIQEEIDRKFWDTLYNRREREAEWPPSIVVVMHRLAELDQWGRFMRREREGKHPPEGWHVLDLQAIRRRSRRTPYPETVTVIDDGRAEGEPLCPEITSVEEWELERATNALTFDAMAQQDPRPDTGGGMFKRHWWSLCAPAKLVEQMREDGFDLGSILAELQQRGIIPQLVREARCYDLGATRGGGDPSASVRGAITSGLLPGHRRVIFTDCWERQIGAEAVKATVLEQAEEDGRHVEIVLPKEPGAAGKILQWDWEADLRARGFVVHSILQTKAKRIRAMPHAGAAGWKVDEKGNETGEEGRCYVLPAGWNDLFRERHHRFDGVTKPLDVVDAAAMLFSVLDGAVTATAGLLGRSWGEAA